MAKPKDELIRIMCPKLGCQRILAVPGSARGKLVRCRTCGTNIKIPLRREDGEVDVIEEQSKDPKQQGRGKAA